MFPKALDISLCLPQPYGIVLGLLIGGLLSRSIGMIIVKQNETIYTIANNYNVVPKDIINDNKLTKPYCHQCDLVSNKKDKAIIDKQCCQLQKEAIEEKQISLKTPDYMFDNDINIRNM